MRMRYRRVGEVIYKMLEDICAAPEAHKRAGHDSALGIAGSTAYFTWQAPDQKETLSQNKVTRNYKTAR